MHASAGFEPYPTTAEDYTVWVGTADKIASFHAVTGYETLSFSCHDHFLSFLCSLQEGGYRFQ